MSDFISNILGFLPLLGVFLVSQPAHGQVEMTWMDIGEMHSRYAEIGAHYEGITDSRGLEWPAILRRSGHYRSKAYWIGLKDWNDESDEHWNYYVAYVGHLSNGSTFFSPVESRLVSKYPDPEVFVDGYPANDKLARVDEVDPDLPADRMLYQKYRSNLGIETERWVYAYANEIHDDYHIIKRRMTNTGNTDLDAHIELDGQSLNDVLFFNMYRWRGREEAGWHSSSAQVWGKFNMVDIVGDGNEEYPVDFTAIYLWAGQDPEFSEPWSSLGSPMLRELNWEVVGDTLGRLAGMSMQGRMVLHADASPADARFDPSIQPSTFGWVDTDGIWAGDGVTFQDLYELVIRTRENPDFVTGGSSRMYPHHADRVEPSGEFWNPSGDPSNHKQGGHSASIAYGPYQMEFGDSIEIVEAEGAAGLSFRAASEIGEAYKRSGFDDDLRIPFDANDDGIINDFAWDYNVYQNGSELQTKNQWILTARDSMFQFMYRARDTWNASSDMTEYPILEPPKPPQKFEVFGRPDKVDLNWETMAGTSDPDRWEIYRTSDYVDRLPYELIATLPGSSRSYEDHTLLRGVDYYYFLQAVGSENPVDVRGLTGTPGGRPLKSSRYLTQTYKPTTLTRLPGDNLGDFRIVPNPINFASDQSVRLLIGNDPTHGFVDFLDIPGRCTITIYTETGEFVHRIEHTSGSGNTSWDLTTSSRQPVVSGLYLVRVVNNDTGESGIQKLVVIK